MIITPHLIVGAAIGAKTHNLGLIIILGLLSHWIMDKIPHWDYSISENIEFFRKTRKVKYLLKPFLKLSLDALIGLIFVFFITYKNIRSSEMPYIVIGVFFSTLPDITLFSSLLFTSEKFSQKYFAFHKKYLHFKHKEKEGKLTFLGLTTEIIIVLIAIALFFV